MKLTTVKEMNEYIPHLKANFAVAWKAFLLMIFHLLHGVFPCRYTSHEFWKITEEREICSACGNEIDPTVCWCGESIPHSPYSEHLECPMGCTCGYSRDTEDV